MENIILTQYSVRGIKSIERWADLSFYKKTYGKGHDFRDYNVKAIYGENGAGKTGLITSARILRELIINPDYLKNTFVQKKLKELVNKKLGFLEFDAEFFFSDEPRGKLYNYRILISKNDSGKYVIAKELLYVRNPFSHGSRPELVYQIDSGKLSLPGVSSTCENILTEQTKNLLNDSSLASVFWARSLYSEIEKISDRQSLFSLVVLFIFGFSIRVYLDSEDEHTQYYLRDLSFDDQSPYDLSIYGELIEDSNLLNVYRDFKGTSQFSPESMRVSESKYESFEKNVNGLKRFLKVFKPQLQDIIIDKRPDQDYYRCSLIMKYEDYSIDAEFESTGIKKLIKLYSYLQQMVSGDIVFIDELDSNLHDVYLCAILEYLMKYGNGQLCFTTHNIGPMDVLKKNKKSIDFLSVNQTVYSWTTSGNYSPSKLYREGMIEGSPFNVDPIDFIGAFESGSEG